MTSLLTTLPASPMLILQTQLSQDMTRFALITAAVLVPLVVVMFLVLRAFRKNLDSSAADALNTEFEKSKESLLLAAQAKKMSRKDEEGTERALSAEEQERQALLENVDADRVFGLTCPLSGLEMYSDQEIVIDPYTGQGYHFSSFLNDWPVDANRPKYIYRHPQGTIVDTSDLIRMH